MLIRSSTTVKTRVVALAGALLATLVALSLLYSFVYAQEGAPVIVYPENETRPVADYSAADPEGVTPIVWSLSGTDANYFNIEGGVLNFKSAPDYENPPAPVDATVALEEQERKESRNVYEVTVEASDGGGANTVERLLFVKVINMDDQGVVTLSSVQPEGGYMLIATLTDQDGLDDQNPPGVIAATSWQWARSMDGVTDWTDIMGATDNEYEPGRSDVGHFLRATAVYWDSESFENPRENYADNFKTAQAVSSERVLMDRIANDPPDFGDREAADGDNTITVGTGGDERHYRLGFPEATEIDPGERRVGENAMPGQPVGNPVVAVDRKKDTLTYSLDGTTEDTNSYMMFDIDPVTGQISLGADTELDFDVENEAARTFEVLVVAADPFHVPGTDPTPITVEPTTGTYDTIEITIRVVNVDENPSIPDTFADTAVLQGPSAIDHPEMSAVIDIDADPVDVEAPNYIMSDPEDTAAVRRWFLMGPDAGKFNISQPDPVDDAENGGDLSFKAAPNYESPGDANGDNVYEITVTAADSAANTASKSVTVKVSNVQEDGNVRLTTLQPEDGIPIRAVLRDQDEVVGGVSWQWYRSPVLAVDAAAPDVPEPDAANLGEWVLINSAEARTDTFTPDANREDAALGELNKHLWARATYTDRFGAVTTADGVTANIVQNSDPDNARPAFAGSSTSRSVLENAPAGTDVGAPVTATDADTDDENVLTYWLSGSDAQYFTINHGPVADNPDTTDVDESGVGGQIKTATRLDFEKKETYNVRVTARDPS